MRIDSLKYRKLWIRFGFVYHTKIFTETNLSTEHTETKETAFNNYCYIKILIISIGDCVLQIPNLLMVKLILKQVRKGNEWEKSLTRLLALNIIKYEVNTKCRTLWVSVVFSNSADQYSSSHSFIRLYLTNKRFLSKRVFAKLWIMYLDHFHFIYPLVLKLKYIFTN